MAFTFGFYNAVDSDRAYTAEQVSSIFEGIITDGIFPDIGDKFAVTPGSGLQVKVGTGKAWFNNTWNLNDAAISLNLDASDPALKRIDAIVLEVDKRIAGRENSIKVIKGTPATSPTVPDINFDIDDDEELLVFRHPLAYVTINNGATSILQSNIMDMRGTEDCLYITPCFTVASEDELREDWQNQFDTWFAELWDELSTDPVTDLQRQLDQAALTVQRHWEQTLSDRTRSAFGLPKTATPDDVFKAISTQNVKLEVGDIRVTLKTDLGENWVACKGGTVSSTLYPELRKIRTSFPNIPDLEGIGHYFIKAK